MVKAVWPLCLVVIVGPVQIGSYPVDIAHEEVIGQVGLAQLGPMQVGPAQVGPMLAGPAQVGPSQVGFN